MIGLAATDAEGDDKVVLTFSVLRDEGNDLGLPLHGLLDEVQGPICCAVKRCWCSLSHSTIASIRNILV